MSAEQHGLPRSVTRARQLLAALVALGAVVTVLIVVLQDQLIRSWAEGRPDTRRVLRTRGLQAVKDGEVHVPAFIPVALVLCVVVALLIWVLAAFLRGGYGWARVALTVTLFFLAVGTIGGLRTGAPVTFMVLSVGSFPIEAAAAYFLWHKDTSAYLKGTWSAPEPADAPI
jgi:hypothetical protein